MREPHSALSATSWPENGPTPFPQGASRYPLQNLNRPSRIRSGVGRSQLIGRLENIPREQKWNILKSPMLRWVPPYAIGAVAGFWMIERVVAFWA
jgi:hypothetical protein